MTGSRTIVLAIALAVSASGTLAHAQPAPRGESAQAVEIHMRAATSAFDEHRYDVAAREFEIAYELSHNASLLFNAGSAWDRVPDPERALMAYRLFLQQTPDGANAVDVRARVQVLERTRTQPVAPAPHPVAVPVPVPVAPLHVATPAPRIVAPRSHPWRVVGIVSGASALLVGAVAIGVYVSASSDYNRLQNSCGHRCSPSDVTSIDRRAAATNALIAVAGAAVALSAVAFVTDLTYGSSEARVAVAAVVVPDGALAVVGGTF